MSWIRGGRLVAAAGAFVVFWCPTAVADPGSPSYLQGKQAIDDQVQQHHVQFPAGTNWQDYCQEELRNVLKSGKVARVDSPPDFIAGCSDEGRALASQ
ncbi:hypothetical protein [Mycobacterium stomatepiae]|uniref:Secreted protein n=1 Tax=Mycobacterium stomatepiae TaxID=470076 RepID=A0A7I7QCR2_9MYCO|nr:hypothetical protein [Mycobacterium stomatepiae]BBY24080.1 hypothetical protein MSTO_42850 [Mycobacterium stomatepiae]